MSQRFAYDVEDLDAQEIAYEVSHALGLLLIGASVGITKTSDFLLARLCFRSQMIGMAGLIGEGCGPAAATVTEYALGSVGLGVVLVGAGFVIDEWGDEDA